MEFNQYKYCGAQAKQLRHAAYEIAKQEKHSWMQFDGGSWELLFEGPVRNVQREAVLLAKKYNTEILIVPDRRYEARRVWYFALIEDYNTA